ncbi:hypothetical protein GH733_003410 [Mirounga leonina]|nr:hypothetical protein GH733_003410 [Mirounga leonina]
MATPGVCTDTVPTTAQAFFLGSILLLATDHRGMMTSASEVPQPVSPDLLSMTNLRVNFSKLHTLGDRPLGGLKRHPFYDYALYELVARGSCLCRGHASECKRIAGTPANVKGMVHGLCVCRHTQLVPTVSAARTCTRTAHGIQQSLGTLSLPG